MGPHNACSYADLSMTTIDYKILNTNNRPNDIIFPPDWSQFRDDCFSPWFGGMPALLEFKEWLNSLSDSIKFTVKYSEVQLEVLDTLLFIINGRIESRVYFKPTDGHVYLLPQCESEREIFARRAMVDQAQECLRYQRKKLNILGVLNIEKLTRSVFWLFLIVK